MRLVALIGWFIVALCLQSVHCASTRKVKTPYTEVEYSVSFSDERPDESYDRWEWRSEFQKGDPARIREIDRWVRDDVGSQTGISLKDLAEMLSGRPRNKREKARAIFTWIAENIAYDVDALHDPAYRPECTPERTLENRKGVCECYSRLFQALAGQMGLQAMVIGGWAKGWERQVGGGRKRFYCSKTGSNPSNHAWNVVKFDDNQWHLVDNTWGSGSVLEDGKKFIKRFKPYYFDTSPHSMILTHLPDTAEFQLLIKPVTCEEFQENDRDEAMFFESGLRFGAEITSHVIKTPDRVLFGLAAEDGTRLSLKIGPRYTEKAAWAKFVHDYKEGDGRRIVTVMIDPSKDGEHEVRFEVDDGYAGKIIVDRRPALHAPDIDYGPVRRRVKPKKKVSETSAPASAPEPKRKRPQTIHLDLDGNGSAVDSVELQDKVAVVRVVRDDTLPVISKLPVPRDIYDVRLHRLGDVNGDLFEDFAIIGSGLGTKRAMIMLGSREGFTGNPGGSLVFEKPGIMINYTSGAYLRLDADYDKNGMADLVFEVRPFSMGYQQRYRQLHLVDRRGVSPRPAAVSGDHYGWRGPRECPVAYMKTKEMKEILRRLREFVGKHKKAIKSSGCRLAAERTFIARLDTSFDGQVVFDRGNYGVFCAGVRSDPLEGHLDGGIATRDLRIDLPRDQNGHPYLCHGWVNLKVPN